MSQSAASNRVVPFVVAHSYEEPAPHSMLAVKPDRSGLCYRVEVPGDRDDRGVLWGRYSQIVVPELPKGEPQFKLLHPARQRKTMMELRCQVCMGPASRTELGWLFLVTRPADGHGPVGANYPEGWKTAQPPLCLKDAEIARGQCPEIMKWHLTVRVGLPRLHGVIGTLYRYGYDGVEPVPNGPTMLHYGNPRASWFLASQLVRELQRCKVVDLDVELAV